MPLASLEGLVSRYGLAGADAKSGTCACATRALVLPICDFARAVYRVTTSQRVIGRVTDGLLAWQGVGKSCLVSQCLGQPFSERHTPTIGVEHHKHTFNVNADAVVVQLWDRGANHCLS